MEPLSGVASGMAVVSLSLQLIQSVDKIRTFIGNVKGAAKELERLAGLLCRLAAILEDTRNLLELQSASQERTPGCSPPSSSVLVCLQSCKVSLQPLETLLQKMQNVPDTSTIRQLRSEIKMGLKTKDIAALETRIQHEISDLSTALGVNVNSLVVTALPLLLQVRHDIKPDSSCLPPPPRIADSNINFTQEIQSGSNPNGPRYAQRTVLIASFLNRLGVQQRRKTRYVMFPPSSDSRNATEPREEVVSEEIEYTASSKMLRLGVRWIVGFTYPRILPSISVYPVIEEFPSSIKDGLHLQNVEFFQHMFSLGQFHPFTRDRHGLSLLHIASYYGRHDICRLLLEYGVKSDLTSGGRSPLWFAMYSFQKKEYLPTCRVFIADLDNTEICDIAALTLPYIYDMRLFSWLWKECQERLFGEPLFNCRRVLLQSSAHFLWLVSLEGRWTLVKEEWKGIIGKDAVNMIEKGDVGLLSIHWAFVELLYFNSWAPSLLPSDSWAEGSTLLENLTKLGIDAYSCITEEITRLDSGIIQNPRGLFADRKVIFEQDESGKWALGWDYSYERHNAEFPKSALFMECKTLMTTFGWKNWPFSQSKAWQHFYQSWDKLSKEEEARFNRRMANKGRKGRTRLGLKQPRSKTPGSWVP